ncbi:hypothetical protein DSS3P1_31 [Ruegeria phage DSS3-P1]|uniref:hypothetical protein n=1 Tax=Ruegeria phage DSS3-P1 TaxID=1555208 RepID=UPI0002357D98|nr:hypothetical protein DSS3P1_31 [Ruegeria phage DSS3-P1]YP_009997248.1 hypothetical protein JT312_gp31 [Ruegeria phage vB_RpoS-V18]YP_009997330.1 hypothetical protein JT313_gp31 [Ruegeria phage vB_RpoS-V11]YP_009997413.1 hypothetical protein JT314_gp32 [Ruegeria phage vB_RpoS-V7]AET42340.1 hypothetical protein SDSG_00075 [Ruegeria phage DSS3-P1]AIT13266.1 hypothetical protein DSS3P1_31 [Ruegeria phage DSS3-P1]AWY08735.1 hypothetical protein vBRpoSV7_32 [Ruegeria phage vB_RpoS-V7]AWY08907.1
MKNDQKHKTAALFGLGAVLLLLGMMPAPARSQEQGLSCLPRQVAVAHLQSKYAETRKGVGLAVNGSILEIWAAESGTWTLTVTYPNGQTCLLGSGENWTVLAETLPNQDDPA